jgi:hypothetical protein
MNPRDDQEKRSHAMTKQEAGKAARAAGRKAAASRERADENAEAITRMAAEWMADPLPPASNGEECHPVTGRLIREAVARSVRDWPTASLNQAAANAIAARPWLTHWTAATTEAARRLTADPIACRAALDDATANDDQAAAEDARDALREMMKRDDQMNETDDQGGDDMTSKTETTWGRIDETKTHGIDPVQGPQGQDEAAAAWNRWQEMSDAEDREEDRRDRMTTAMDRMTTEMERAQNPTPEDEDEENGANGEREAWGFTIDIPIQIAGDGCRQMEAVERAVEALADAVAAATGIDRDLITASATDYMG